jgi:hypothetical protein
MALGTPTFRGFASRNSGTSDITISSFTPGADDLLLVMVGVAGTGSPTPDSITGHTADFGWTLHGSTAQVASEYACSIYLACPGSSPSAGTIVVANSTAGFMFVQCVSISGADITSAANAIDQSDIAAQYGSPHTLSLTTPSNTIINFWTSEITSTGEGTELDQSGFKYGNRQAMCEYNSADATPSITFSYGYSFGAALEIAEAAGGTNISGAVDALTLTEYSSTVNLARDISATVDALTLTEYQATVQLVTNISGAVDAFLLQLMLL